ncbi:MAG: Hsp20/alpha crystallin family protein [Aquificae bacterium]|nr:Hsp20/alpha crystallin family protein [Aquificota bacterium]
MERRDVPSRIGWNPLKELARIESELNKLFSEFIPTKEDTQLVAWSPRVDVYEQDNNIIIEAEIPGAKKEDIEVKIKDNAVIIRGEVKKEEEKKEGNYYKKERFYGTFERIIPLPTEVKAEEAKAEFKDGILKLILPKANQEHEVKIEVK